MLSLQLLHSQETVNDTTENSSFVFLPVIFHTPETQLAGGMVAQYNYRDSNNSPESRPSVLTPLLIYTQNKQFIGELGFDLYFQNELYHLTGGVLYKIFPNTYFGIGNDTPDENEEKYTSNNFLTSFTFLKQVLPFVNIGINYDFEKMNITKKDSLLSNSETTGKSGGLISGIGPAIHFDTRDNVNFPMSGHFYQGSVLFYQPFLGSDFQYHKISLDLRKYFTFFEKHTVAFQSFSQFINGNVPFNKLSQLGGSRILRGYFEGRYRDKNILFLQSEYRSPTWYNIGYVAFVGLGEVAPNIDDFSTSAMKYSIGFGLRYMFIPKEKLNLRLDFGFVKGGFEFYANFAESF